MLLSFRGAVGSATQRAEIQVALRAERPHAQLARQREGLEASLLPIAGELERLPGALESLGWMRGLAGRAPYFHNGSAATLLDVVNFYDARFALGLTRQQKLDLVAFLRTL